MSGPVLVGLILLMNLMGAVASLFLKRAAGDLRPAALVKNLNLYAGAGLYLGCALLNILALRYLDFSVVLPLTAITYVWTLALSRLVLGERVTWRKALGVGLIILGALLIASRV